MTGPNTKIIGRLEIPRCVFTLRKPFQIDELKRTMQERLGTGGVHNSLGDAKRAR
jgi:hypothetical protein